jgi:hypothetical protein
MELNKDPTLKNCVPKIPANSRIFTSFKPSKERNFDIQSVIGASNNEQYREFLRENGPQIMDYEWNAIKENTNCNEMPCFFEKPSSRVTPEYQSWVLQSYNNYFLNKEKEDLEKSSNKKKGKKKSKKNKGYGQLPKCSNLKDMRVSGWKN